MDQKGGHVGRRNFIKATTLAGMAATLPAANLVAQDIRGALKPSPQGTKRHLLFMTDTPAAYETLTDSIKT